MSEWKIEGVQLTDCDKVFSIPSWDVLKELCFFNVNRSNVATEKYYNIKRVFFSTPNYAHTYV